RQHIWRSLYFRKRCGFETPATRSATQAQPQVFAMTGTHTCTPAEVATPYRTTADMRNQKSVSSFLCDKVFCWFRLDVSERGWTRLWRRRVGVEPTKDRQAALSRI